MAHDLQWIWYDGQAWEWLGLGEGQPIMNNLIRKLLIKFKDRAQRDEGQDLVDYALVVALIAFGATAGMGLWPAESTTRSTLSAQPSPPASPSRCQSIGRRTRTRILNALDGEICTPGSAPGSLLIKGHRQTSFLSG